MKRNLSSYLKHSAFHYALRKRASPNETIVLASVDSGYLDMAINLYVSSLRRFSIENYLFVGSDPAVCVALSALNITCVEYIRDRDAESASVYSSDAFKRKTHLKTKMVLEALRLGLSVLLVDLDVVFFANPLPLFACDACDLEISSDVIAVNSGFYFARSTPAALKLHKNAWNYGLARPDVSNQKVIGQYLNRMKGRKEINVKHLDPEKYVNGKQFFYDGARIFKGDNPCSDCIVVHNNWIVSLAAKIYRFKEFGLWHYDKDGYYSNETNKYLSFSFPKRYEGMQTNVVERNTLKNALIVGALLNRIVILPKFHCIGRECFHNRKTCPVKCSLGSELNMEVFDNHLNGKYRESVFLTHDKVPNAIKRSLSPYYMIVHRGDEGLKNIPIHVRRRYAKSPDVVTSTEIMHWFRNRTEAVLRFYSLYDVWIYDENDRKIQAILRRIEKAFEWNRHEKY
ncbi:hypothetical protein LSH36_964g00005 [Paralvinella palmiformis]|uniref:Nucleotide-diphospho-sugar transferase domain-containing protein n=1 Tax=Paralvinella palmiformis TaxID=53620 RepID=A0AAD9IXJ6_9ANNE|nr:hypothetical protein LSH36_964g00005 [Paralvinella palmiformis]